MLMYFKSVYLHQFNTPIHKGYIKYLVMILVELKLVLIFYNLSPLTINFHKHKILRYVSISTPESTLGSFLLPYSRWLYVYVIYVCGHVKYGSYFMNLLYQSRNGQETLSYWMSLHHCLSWSFNKYTTLIVF